MPYEGFEPTIPASERAKTVHTLDRATTVAGVQQVVQSITDEKTIIQTLKFDRDYFRGMQA
jgi:hypothetical protein